MGACFQGVTRSMIIEKGTLGADRYIEEVLSIALKDGKGSLGNDFTFQPAGVSLHKDEKTQLWYKSKFSPEF